MSACLSMQATEPLQLFVVLFVVFELSIESPRTTDQLPRSIELWQFLLKTSSVVLLFSQSYKNDFFQSCLSFTFLPVFFLSFYPLLSGVSWPHQGKRQRLRLSNLLHLALVPRKRNFQILLPKRCTKSSVNLANSSMVELLVAICPQPSYLYQQPWPWSFL